MRAAKREIAAILSAQHGVIARRHHPELANALGWLVRQGELQAVLPGVYAPRHRVNSPQTRIHAAMVWAPDAVLTGPAAALVSFWPGIQVDDVTVALRQRSADVTGFVLSRRRIPPELVQQRDHVRFSKAALTALDLCSSVGGDGIDNALRTRWATLDGMREAMQLTQHRVGNRERRLLLLDSRDEPWSAAERLCHRLLRSAGITGWRANVAVPSLGSVYYLDVAFERQKVALEIDGRLHQTDRNLFESDRWRQNHLVLDGWRVLRCTWSMLEQHPDLVMQTVKRTLDLNLSPEATRPEAAMSGRGGTVSGAGVTN